MSTQHTPTPWTQRPVCGPLAKDTYQAVIVDANGEGVADVMHGPTATADAAHIVRCVNSHDALVDTTRRMLEHFETTIALSKRDGNLVDAAESVMADVRAALKAATEGA